MEDFGSDKEFIEEEVIKIICDAIQNVFGIKAKYENADQQLVETVIENEKDRSILQGINYNKEKATLWCGQLIDQCIRGVIKLNKPFKYVVTCVMQQNNGAGMNTFGCGYFEESDGSVSKSIAINDLYFSITIFAVLI